VVAGSVFVYILLIGPGDYFLVRNFFKRMELTWITFPSIVLLVSVGAYLMAVWAKGSELRLNQVDLVDVLVERDSPANFARGTTWLNIFTPRTDAYHLSLEPRLPDGTAPEPNQAKVLLSWLGVPGGGLGGSDQRRSSQPLFNRPYRFSQELDQLDQLPIQVWSTKGLTSRWYAPEDGSLEIDLKLSEDQNLEGQITNTLKVPLEDCWLAYDRWVYRIGKFEPGETLDVKSRWRDREVLTSALTENKLDYDAQKKQSVLVSTPYDQESFDVRRILRQMMFHKASGGDAYARLTNRYQSFVDMSDHLTLGRAILVGYTDQPSAQLQRSFDGGQTWTPVKGPEDRRWTCYRFVVPVE
jgi:hypothetical protein